MMNEDDKTRLAMGVLSRGKVLAPDKFPKPDMAVAEAWGSILGRLNVPMEVWPEAVDLWAAERAGEGMVTPRDLLAAARDVRDRWERDPERRKLLEQYRLARREARDAALERGELRQVRTMPSIDGVRWPNGDEQRRDVAVGELGRGSGV